METCNYLLYLALILMCTKFLGLLTRRARMPQVVGALLAGLDLLCLRLFHRQSF